MFCAPVVFIHVKQRNILWISYTEVRIYTANICCFSLSLVDVINPELITEMWNDRFDIYKCHIHPSVQQYIKQCINTDWKEASSC